MFTRRGQRQPNSPATEAARLKARPEWPRTPDKAASPGLHPLALGARRDGLLYVPAGYRADRPAPLAVMLHGAGGEGRGGLAPFHPLADAAGLLLLAPEARRQTWDVIARTGYGPDVTFIDRVLAQIFDRYAVDPERVAVGGFSDGASYALSLGLTNGDLFTHVIAFSPGFMAPAGNEGSPRIFISHGQHDNVLPIDACSRRLVAELRSSGYDVTYREFDGPHTVPPAIAREALDWFLQPSLGSTAG
jgi:phospholipase/carboxylesterase